MSKNRHHYVPRFYLKNFANDFNEQNPRLIDIYNIKDKKIINNASLRDQCYKKKFYGKTNEVEDTLALLEGSFSKIIKKIICKNKLPLKSSDEIAMIFLFVAIQYSRTKKIADKLNSTFEKFGKLVLLRSKLINDNELKKIRISINDPIQYILKEVLRILVSIEDLELCLLKSSVKTKFITSDSPVAVYNKYCEGNKGVGTTGFLSSGIQIFVPISPEFCLFFYDSRVYKVGNKKKSFYSLINYKDIDLINSLQFIGADSNLYFFHFDLSQKYFSNLDFNLEVLRQEFDSKVSEYVEESNQNDTIILTYNNIPNITMNLSFVSINRNANQIDMVDRIHLYRKDLPEIPGDEKKDYKKITEEDAKKVFKLNLEL